MLHLMALTLRNLFITKMVFISLQIQRDLESFLRIMNCIKKILSLPGVAIECGIFKGNSLFRFAHFREILEMQDSRKLIGFDMFDEFPQTDFEADKTFREAFIQEAGKGITEEELCKVLDFKKIRNYELIKGDITRTVPQYCISNPQLKLHFST